MKYLKKIIIIFIITILIINTSSVIAVATISERIENVQMGNAQNTTNKEDSITRNSEKEPKLIKLEENMLQDENIFQITADFIRTSKVLVDDQELLPILPSDKMEKDTLEKIKMDNWYPSTTGNNIQCYIDLGTEYEITNIAYYDTNGTADIKFSFGSPFHWNEIFSVKTDAYKEWKNRDVTGVNTRYIRIETLSGTNAGISEIALYGYKTGEEAEVKDESLKYVNPDFNITTEKRIGTNGFIDDPMDILSVAGTIREYHNLRWTLDSKDANKFNPSYGGKWDFDTYYKNLYELGIDVMPCIQGTSKVIRNTPNMSLNAKPVPVGMDSLNPESYKIHASTMFQYAARYGSEKIADEKLLLADDQEKKSGLRILNIL